MTIPEAVQEVLDRAISAPEASYMYWINRHARDVADEEWLDLDRLVMALNRRLFRKVI